MQCIFPQGQTTPERILSNPWYDKGFCQPHQYKAAIDRCKGGQESCDLFIDIFSQRAKIERDYIDDLEKWASTSIKDISRSKEFGTNKKTWIETIRASAEISKAHKDISDRLQNDVINKMVDFKKDHYGRSVVHVKKIKEFDRDFEQVQKPWLKLLEKIDRARKEYEDAQQLLKRAETAEKIIESDHGAETDQKNKVKLSVSTHKKESEAAKNKYQQYIEEMKNTRPSYENSMKEVLDRTHEFERKRLNQFKMLFTALHHSQLIDRNSHLQDMNELFTKAVKSHDIEKDIQWWNSHFGSDTNTIWPSFEEL